MELAPARNLARTLMRQHGVGLWRFEFDRAVKRFGLTNFRTRTISLSAALVQLNPESEVRQVILHEIAHALAGVSAGHGPAWLSMARSIGYTGKATHNAATPSLRYQGKCARGHTTERQRAPKAGLRYSCRKCGPSFNVNHLFTWTDKQTGKVLGECIKPRQTA